MITFLYSLLFVIFNVFYVLMAGISPECLNCICQVEGCDNEIGKCTMDKGSLSCGPYQIKNLYWIDCGSLGGDYQTCTKTKQCSEQCVKKYMERYGTYCTGGSRPTCQDIAKIHNGGPNGCKNRNNEYWEKVQTCLNPHRQSFQ